MPTPTIGKTQSPRRLFAHYIATLLPRQFAVLVLLGVAFVLSPAVAQTVWVGTNNVTVTTNWSDTANWSTAASPAFTDVMFTNNGVVPSGVINNVVDSSVTIASLRYSHISTNVVHTTLIAPGVNLEINGLSAPNNSALLVGTGDALTDGLPAQTNRITGVGGTLTINNNLANVIIRQGPNGAALANRTTLDLSGLDNFNATVGRVLLSANVPNALNRASGRLILARTNFITAGGASPALIVGDSASNNGNGSTLFLGQTNILFVNNISVAREKETGSRIGFAAGLSSPGVLIRGANGSGAVTTWNIGDGLADTGTTTCNGTVDFSGGYVDALIGTLIVGRGSSGGTGGNQSVGTFTFNSGTVEVGTLQMGLQGGSTPKGGSGTVTVNTGGTLIVTTSLEMGRTVGNTGPTLCIARLNINGGTVRTPTINANFASSTNNFVAMNGGTLVVTNNVGPGVRGLAMTNSTLTIPALISGPTFIATNYASGGTTNVINITAVPNVTGYPAQFTLIKYAGPLTGVFNTGLGSLPVSTPAYAGYISNDVANSSVELVITGGPVPLRSLFWDGTLNGDWDVDATANWKTNAGPSTTFSQGDFVRLDDSATGTTAVNLLTTVAPSLTTVSNVNKAYGFTGGGNLSGTGGLTKQGAGTLYITNSGINDYTGPNSIVGTIRVGDGGFAGNIGPGDIADNGALIFNRADDITVSNNISGSGSLTKLSGATLTVAGNNSFLGPVAVTEGTLNTLNNTALGATNGATTVSSGATLDVNGRNLGAELVNVTGTGVGGAAIINSGAQALNALRYVTMQGNTTVGGSGRWDIRAAPSTADPTLAGLSTGGNAYKLTKINGNQISLVGVTVDPQLGEVEVQGGVLSLETAATGLGNPASVLTVNPGASFQFFNLTNQLNKVISLGSDGGTASIINGSGANTIVGPVTMTNDCTFTINGTSLALNSVAGGKLIKQGAGNLILSGAATHSSTLVNVGTLTVNGVHSGGITNSGFSAVAGSGTNNGATDVLGLLLPGGTNVVGTLTLNELVLEGGATVGMELGTANTIGSGVNDLVVVNGNLTVNGNNININPTALLQIGVPYRLFNYTGTLIENAPFNAPSVNSYIFTIDTSTPGQVNLVASGGPPVWNGGSATVSLWSDPANWNGVTIQPGNSLIFAGNNRLNNTNDTAADTTYADILFNSGAGAFVLNGNHITLGGNIVNSSTNTETVNLGLNFNSPRALGGANGRLVIGGGLTNTTGPGFNSILLTGTGTLTNLLQSVDVAGTNFLALSGTNSNWNWVDNATATPITVPWGLSLSNGTLNFGNAGSAPVFTSTTVNGVPIDNQMATVAGNTGTLNVFAGTLSTTARFNTATALNSTGIVNQVGGTINFGNQFQGANGGNAGQMSTLNVSGGTMNIGTAAAPNSQLYLASRGNGLLNLSGSGVINCGILDLSRNAAGNTIQCIGTVNLNGGILAVTRVGTATANAQPGVSFGPAATFNFNGGTLKARAASTTFFQGSTVAPIIPITAIVKAGGAIIDTTNFNISIVEPMIHDAGLGATPDGGLVKLGSAILTLLSANTYTGPTVISNGTILVNGSIGASAVAVESGGWLGGGGSIGSNVTVRSGGTISGGPVGTVGTLTIAGNVTMQSGAVVFMELNKTANSSDQIRAIAGTPPTITYAGTLSLANLSGTLAAGDSFKLFAATNYAGSFSAITPATPGPGLKWITTALNTTGTISIGIEPVARITSIGFVGGNVVLSGTNGPANAPYWVLTSTNVGLPLASWTPIGTNNFDGSGNFSFTNGVPAAPYRFYLLQVP